MMRWNEGAARSKTTYEGREYDYVFDIELDDTKASLKLPYNVSEDPYHAAQKFIHKHELSQYFLDQIAHFIINNTRSETIGDQNATRSYFDPFTGENRYVPPAAAASAEPNGTGPSYADPFTGFDPVSSPSQQGSINHELIRFEGSGAYKTGSSIDVDVARPHKQARGNEYYPHLELILFDQVNSEPILRKAKELQQAAHLGGDLSNIQNLMSRLDRIDSKDDFQTELQSLFEMMSSWPRGDDMIE